jgi:hypothetical protein
MKIESPFGADGTLTMRAEDQTLVNYATGWGQTIPTDPFMPEVTRRSIGKPSTSSNADSNDCGQRFKFFADSIQIDCGQRCDDCGQQLPVDGFMGSCDGVCVKFSTPAGFFSACRQG